MMDEKWTGKIVLTVILLVALILWFFELIDTEKLKMIAVGWFNAIAANFISEAHAALKGKVIKSVKVRKK